MYKIDNILKNTAYSITRVMQKEFSEDESAFSIVEHVSSLHGDPEHDKSGTRQLLCNISRNPVTTQPNSLLWSVGEIVVIPPGKKMGGLKDVTIKPEYAGSGFIMLKPVHEYFVVIRMDEWNMEQVTVDESCFVACDASIKQKVVPKNTMSSSVSGGRGQNNLAFSGKGIIILKSPVETANLTGFRLEKDVLKVDEGKLLAWSSQLIFSVDSQEDGSNGYVHTLRGSGRALVAP